MTQPTPEEVWKDPDFQDLSIEQKRAVLRDIDPDFKDLPVMAQDQVLGVHTVLNAPNRTETKQGPLDILSNAADKIQGTMPYAAGLMAPSLGLGFKAVENMNNATGQLGQSVAEAAAEGRQIPNAVPLVGGKRIPPVPGPAAATLGTVASIVANPQTYVNPGAGVTARVVKPMEVPSDLASTGVPFTKAEITGSRAASQLEAGLDKTPTGGLLIDAFRKGQKAAIENFADLILRRHGTTEPAVSTGMTIRSAADAEKAANKATNDALYKKVPMDAKVPAAGLVKLYKSLEAKLSPRLKELVKGNGILVDENPVRPGDVGEFKGVTTQLPDEVVPGRTVVTETPIEQSSVGTAYTRGADGKIVGGGEPPSYYTAEQIPEQRIPGKNEYGISYHAEPGKPTQLPNAPYLEQMKQLRTELGAEAKKGGVDGLHAGALRDAITSDIENLANNGSAIDRFVGKDAAQSFRTATNYNREMRTLYEHPVAKQLLDATISKTPDVIFGRGYVEDVQVGRAVLGEVGFKAAQKSFFTDLLHTKDIGKALSKYDPEFLNQALTSQQLSSLKLLDKVKKTALGAEKQAPMTGSARMNAAIGTAGIGYKALKLAATGNIQAAIALLVGGLGLPYAAAKMYLAQATGMDVALLSPKGSRAVAASTAAAQSQPKSKLDIIRQYLKKR